MNTVPVVVTVPPVAVVVGVELLCPIDPSRNLTSALLVARTPVKFRSALQSTANIFAFAPSAK